MKEYGSPFLDQQATSDIHNKMRAKQTVRVAKRVKVSVKPAEHIKRKRATNATLAGAKPKTPIRESNSPRKAMPSSKTAPRTTREQKTIRAEKTARIAKVAAAKRSAKPPRKRSEPGVPAVRQPDGVSCGWATTKWLLNSFGVLDVTDRQLRTELNTDAERGVRAWWNRRIAPFIGRKFGKDWESGDGTLPMAIFSALRKRGIVLKNPVRLESPLEFTDYLNDTFRAGGRAAILIWRGIDFMHWMGAMRDKGHIRIMDPATGTYEPFIRGLRRYKQGKQQPHFLVFGFVRD